LPAGLAQALEPELQSLAEEIIGRVASDIPEYAGAMEGSYGLNIRRGVEVALRDFVDVVRRPGGRSNERPGVYRALGRGELREGRSLDALQAAYRLGARLAWRRLGRAAAAAGHGEEVQRTLAEAIFAYIDELAAESVEGYSGAQAERAGERDRRRRQLLARLLEGAPAEELQELAEQADWRAPELAAACATEPDRLHAAVRR
jgi:hypothetical protein